MYFVARMAEDTLIVGGSVLVLADNGAAPPGPAGQHRASRAPPLCVGSLCYLTRRVYYYNELPRLRLRSPFSCEHCHVYIAEILRLTFCSSVFDDTALPILFVEATRGTWTPTPNTLPHLLWKHATSFLPCSLCRSGTPSQHPMQTWAELSALSPPTL